MNDPIMSFGMHRGRRVSQVPTQYLRWCLQTVNLERYPDLRDAMRRELDGRGRSAGDASHAASTDRTAGALAIVGDVVRSWYREMALRFHPDRGGSTEAMQVINHAHERLLQRLQERGTGAEARAG